MNLYRYSPIRSREQLIEAITHIHFACHALCKQSLGYYLPNSGNIGVFAHYDQEYEELIKIREELTNKSESFNQKYIRLYEPIIIPAKKDVPETIYTHLYIRKPDPYRHHVGDIDFYLEQNKYRELKTQILSGNNITGARIFERVEPDMLELYNPDIDVLAYISTHKMEINE